MASPHRIDVHHHFVPSKFATALEKYGNPEWPTPEWTVPSSQSLGQNLGISTAILSLTSPGVDVVDSIDDQLAIARDANDTAAKVRDTHPSQFGFFATIPNPVKYPAEALEELTRAMDELHADGLTLLTSYSDDYLGRPSLAPLWTELNRRKAVVFVHPTSPPGDYKPVSKSLLPPAMDFTFETSRTASDLVQSGTMARNPDVKIILSHAGGTLPWSWHRVASLPKSMSMIDMTLEEFREQARNFYFDVALTGYGENLELLMKFAKEGHVLYGSDFPYAPNDLIQTMTDGLDKYLAGKGDEVAKSVNFGSALELFPRLKEYRKY